MCLIHKAVYGFGSLDDDCKCIVCGKRNPLLRIIVPMTPENIRKAQIAANPNFGWEKEPLPRVSPCEYGRTKPLGW